MRRWPVFVLAFLIMSTLAQDRLPLWFESWRVESAPTDTEAREAAVAAASVLFGLAGDVPALPTGQTARFVILTVREGDERPRSYAASGIGLADAINQALSAIPPGTEPTRARLDIVIAVVRERLVAPEFTVHHTADAWGLAFLSPELGIVTAAELTANSLISSSGSLNREAWLRFAALRGDDADALSTAFTRSPLDVYRFQTVGFDLSAEGALPNVPNRLFPLDLTPESLMEAAHAGGEYLKRAVDGQGRFVYSYDPGMDTAAADYNILRHAGTAYSMLELYRRTGDTGLLVAAERALAFLDRQIEPCAAPVSVEAAGCLLETGEVKLGGAGLALLAFSEHADITGDPRYLETMRGLGGWIAGAQHPDGRFVHKVEDGQIDDFESLYYPGEAIFGLMRLYALDPDPRWLEAARAGADYIILIRDIDTPSSDLEHDHWFLYALDALHRVDPQAHDLVHLRRLVLEILSAQHLDSVPDTWLGGYYNPPRSTPTATRSEGLCAAARLLRDLGDTRSAETVFEAVLWGISFQLQTQITEADTLFMANPSRAIGGFRESLLSGEVRIDFVQHNISALLCARDGLTP